MKLQGTKTGKHYKVVKDKDGKERVVLDRKSMLNSLPVNQRVAARKTAQNKVRFGKSLPLKGG